MDDESNQIIAFRPKPDSPSISGERVRKGVSACRHRTILVCETRRIMECKDCGQCFEPFDYIWRKVADQEFVWDQLPHIKEQIAKATDELANLKNYITNAKAQLKRVLKKQEPA